ncbi:MAG TPA: type II secretion system F family protein [Solirubrobacterales bacterium]|jgi:tight adherence protein C
MSLLLAACGGALAFAAAWELAGLGVREEAARRARRWTRRALGFDADQWLARRDVAGRLRRAGLGDRLSPRRFLALKAGGAVAGLCAWVTVLPVAPGRLAVPLAALLAAGGALAPDAWLDRRIRARTARLVAALPDALDLLAVGAAAGRQPAALFAELARRSRGPLATELATAVAEMECGVPQAEALRGLRERVPDAAVAALAAALERSRRYGSPLAEQLHEQAASLRRDERRRIEERAARAAPKIQLVVAMVLVPSVLLVIAAALIAHADSLFGAL